jgi:hypothetical protein
MMATGKVRAALWSPATVGLLTLGGAAAPAMAQSPGFGFGDGFDEYDRDHDRFFPELIMCLTDNQVRQAVADRGYTNISLNVPNDKRVQVRATKGGTVYLLKFNLCTGRIEDRDALRRAQ